MMSANSYIDGRCLPCLPVADERRSGGRTVTHAKREPGEPGSYDTYMPETRVSWSPRAVTQSVARTRVGGRLTSIAPATPIRNSDGSHMGNPTNREPFGREEIVKPGHRAVNHRVRSTQLMDASH